MKARGEDEGVAVFAILVENEVAGMIQHWEETDEELGPIQRQQDRLAAILGYGT